MGERVTEYEQAVAAERRQAEREPRAMAARYDRRSRNLIVTLRSGVEIRVPTKLAQGLAQATAADLSEIEISPSGHGLHFPLIDADLSVPGLFANLFGSREWMSRLAAHGGSATSPLKSATARANGMRGGRPRKMG